MPAYFHPISPAETAVREKAKSIVDQTLRPFAKEDDQKCFFRRSAYQELAKAGLIAISAPKAFGGGNESYRCYYAVIEEIARASAAMAVTAGVTNLVQGALINFGTDDQRKKHLTKLVTGEAIGAFSLSEPGAGSDAASLKCAAKKVKDRYVVTGTKLWCSTAGEADLYLLMARTGEHRYKGITSFLVSKDTPGFKVGKQEKKMGLRASPLAELIFEEAEIPVENRIGEEGEGLKVALSQLDYGRISIGAVGGALAGEAIDVASTVVKDQNALEFLADHYARWQSVKLLVGEAAGLRDAKKPLTAIASMTKLLGSDLAVAASSDALTLLGPLGATDAYPVERYLRDAKALQIVEGANQIQRTLLARVLQGESK